jgi:hypothetical protein
MKCPIEKVTHDINRFDVLRREMMDLMGRHADPVHTEQVLLYYFYQLKSLLLRFQPLENKIRLEFSWADPFVRDQQCTMTSLYFELTCVLWNLGAFESQFGVNADRSTDDGTRLAGKHFQQAAGYFDYLKEHILPALNSITPVCSLPCFNRECVAMMKSLTLAQAQQCFYEKAVRDKSRSVMKTDIVAKLASQTAIFYNQTLARSQTLGTYLDISWKALITFQAKSFNGATEYWQALDCRDLALARGSGFGEEVARYYKAEKNVQEAINSAKSMKDYNYLPTLIANATVLLRNIQTNRIAAEREMKALAGEKIPPETEIPAVPGLVMVRPTPIPTQGLVIPSMDAFLFKFVFPPAILNEIQRFYQEMKAAYTSAAVSVEESTKTGKSTLSSVRKTMKKREFCKVTNIPRPLWEKIKEIQKIGSVDKLKAAIVDLIAAEKKVKASLDVLETGVAYEEDKDNLFWEKYPDYSGKRSTVLNEDVQNNLKAFKYAYHDAFLRDQMLTKRFNENNMDGKLLLLTSSKEELLKLLEADPRSLIDLMPTMPMKKEMILTRDRSIGLGDGTLHPSQPVSVKSTDCDLLGPEGQDLEMKLYELSQLMEVRRHSMDRLKRYQSINVLEEISMVLIANGNVQETVFTKYNNDFQTIKKEIDQSFVKQAELQEEITKYSASFEDLKETKTHENNLAIVVLKEMIELYFSCLSQSKATLAFFADLQAKLTLVQEDLELLERSQEQKRQEYAKLKQHQSYQIPQGVMGMSQPKENEELTLNAVSTPLTAISEEPIVVQETTKATVLVAPTAGVEALKEVLQEKTAENQQQKYTTFRKPPPPPPRRSATSSAASSVAVTPLAATSTEPIVVKQTASATVLVAPTEVVQEVMMGGKEEDQENSKPAPMTSSSSSKKHQPPGGIPPAAFGTILSDKAPSGEEPNCIEQ